MPPFRHELQVRYNECDPQNIVFNANYFTYFDITITELWRTAFQTSYASMIADHGIDMVVAEASARFHGSARFDDRDRGRGIDHAPRDHGDDDIAGRRARRGAARGG